MPPRVFTNEFAHIRPSYRLPQNPVVLCHGLLGMDVFKSPFAPIIRDFSYWGGIKEALAEKGVRVYSGNVPPTSSVKSRAEMLYNNIKAQGLTTVNLIGHSMGGLDARYLASKLCDDNIQVKSVTTISTPHHGSSFADYLLLKRFSKQQLKYLFGLLALIKINDSTGFEQLTTHYLKEEFNKEIIDNPNVKYISYGARFTPHWYNLFRYSWKKIYEIEGDNDGMVSVESAHWNEYAGTLDNCDHLDITNMLRRKSPNDTFNPTAFYLKLMDDLADMGF